MPTEEESLVVAITVIPRVFRNLVLLVGVLSLAPVEASAIEPYFELRGGVSIAPENDSKVNGVGGDVKYNANGTIGLGFGVGLFKYLRQEAAIDFRAAGLDQLSINNVVIDGNGEINVVTFMSNTYLDAPIFGEFFVPYAGVGIGVAVLEGSASIARRTDIGGTTTELAYSFMGGTTLHFSKSTAVSLGYRYLDTGSGRFETETQGVQGAKIELYYEAHEVTFGLRYTF